MFVLRTAYFRFGGVFYNFGMAMDRVISAIVVDLLLGVLEANVLSTALVVESVQTQTLEKHMWMT